MESYILTTQLVSEAFKTVTAEKHDPDTNMKNKFLLSNLFGFLLLRQGQIFHPFQLLKFHIVHVNPFLLGLHRQIIIFVGGEKNSSLTFQGRNEDNTIPPSPSYLAYIQDSCKIRKRFSN